MASKVLVLGISGSPRKDGNTDIAVKRTLEAISRLRDVETLFIRVADFNIKHCIGCRECMKIGECAIRDDDFNIILEKLMQAEMIVVGAPVFWNSPPGVMKDFIDRTHGFYTDRKRLLGKKVGIISVAAESGFESHEDILSWMRIYGAEIVGKVRIYAREKGEILQRPKEIAKVERFARILAERLQ
ncbi:MAG: NADPH-dependent FMN reductase [Candidatus Bathyarchaeota archaeon B26-2]|nr:MAG: NADPH-dependent FMN reductase [Candidatus Bathyarchaeota archaeon B26-2]